MSTLAFADWCWWNCKNDHHGLKPEYVSQIRKFMEAPECRAIKSWPALKRVLKKERSTGIGWLFWDNDLTWERFLLTAECMWDSYREHKANEREAAKKKAEHRRMRRAAMVRA